MKKSQLAIVLPLILLAATPIIMSAFAITTTPGPYLDQITFFKETNEEVAMQKVSDGTADAYAWRIPLALIDQAKANPNLKLTTSPGNYMSFVFNPAPIAGEFNPFAIKEFRQAMQSLIDRQTIVNTILKGNGIVKIMYFAPIDPDYAYVMDMAEAYLVKYAYSIAETNALVSEALTNAGCAKVGGKWQFNGIDITVKFFIRSDDPVRKAIGDMFSADLAKIGITVDPIYGDLNKAYEVVYGSDPKDGLWHIYTEGWGASGLSAYDEIGLPQMYAPWQGNMPGWGEPSFWGFQDAAIDDISFRYASGDFKSLDERNSLLRDTVRLGMEDAVRVFIAQQLENYPSNSKYPAFAADLATAIRSRWTWLTFQKTAGVVGGTAIVAQKQMYQDAYNPISGFTSVYSTIIRDLVQDFGLWTDPHTGKYIAVRTPYVVQTAGPTGKLSVPAGAIKWNATSHAWFNVTAGVNATSKITYTLKFSNWHDGAPMSMADVLYGFYFLWEWTDRANAADLRFDSYYAGLYGPAAAQTVAIKAIAADKIEVYANYWFPDDTYIANFGGPWVVMPWELMAACEKAVTDGPLAWSRAAATAKGGTWLDLTKGPSLAVIDAKFEAMKAANSIPDALQGKVTAADATARWNALGAWYTAKGHFLDSNGPFYFDKADTTALQDTIKANRDPTYPYMAGAWDSLIPVNMPSIGTIQMADNVPIGSDAKVNVTLLVGGQPSSAATLRYLLLDADANVFASGIATPSATVGLFQFTLPYNLTGRLLPGTYSLRLGAFANAVAIPTFATKTFTTLPAYVILSGQIAQLTSNIQSVSTDVSSLRTQISALQSQLSSMQIWLYVGGAGFILSLIALILLFLRKPQK
jgi:peptide/nickel transport system substrate-binding protein